MLTIRIRSTFLYVYDIRSTYSYVYDEHVFCSFETVCTTLLKPGERVTHFRLPDVTTVYTVPNKPRHDLLTRGPRCYLRVIPAENHLLAITAFRNQPLPVPGRRVPPNPGLHTTFAAATAQTESVVGGGVASPSARRLHCHTPICLLPDGDAVIGTRARGLRLDIYILAQSPTSSRAPPQRALTGERQDEQRLRSLAPPRGGWGRGRRRWGARRASSRSGPGSSGSSVSTRTLQTLPPPRPNPSAAAARWIGCAVACTPAVVVSV
jgi:hypothetical protein